MKKHILMRHIYRLKHTIEKYQTVTSVTAGAKKYKYNACCTPEVSSVCNFGARKKEMSFCWNVTALYLSVQRVYLKLLLLYTILEINLTHNIKKSILGTMHCLFIKNSLLQTPDSAGVRQKYYCTLPSRKYTLSSITLFLRIQTTRSSETLKHFFLPFDAKYLWEERENTNDQICFYLL